MFTANRAGLQKPHSPRYRVADLVFLLFAAAYALLALDGILPISANGVMLDSDLETYAQGMAGEAHPEFFGSDPVLREVSPANSIKNAERMLGSRLMPQDSPGIGLLRAGAVAIFVFYAGWYAFGRWLFTRPALAAILSLTCGITIWVGWGTFWGITHSDPIPRVFFAAIFPFLLLLAIAAVKKTALRPPACLACGLCMWIHGISALNCGAMFLLAFFLLKPAEAGFKTHIFNTLLCFIAFIGPTLVFLWASLVQSASFSDAEIKIFREVFDLRWQEDYSDFSSRIIDFLRLSNPSMPIILCGLAAWLLCAIKGSSREKAFCALCPGFLAALIIMTLICWAESHYAPRFGRLPMGHEIVRGLRFLVPISWILIVGAGAILTGKWFQRAFLAVLACALAIFTVDRQYAAAQYSLSRITGVQLPLYEQAELWKKRAEQYREVLQEIREIVPQGEAVFATGNEMGIRYYSLRPLVHTFKDGYVFFYNKDFPESARWLEYEKIMRQSPDGFLRAWLQSGARWLLCRQNEDIPALREYGNVVMNKHGWLLIRKKPEN